MNVKTENLSSKEYRIMDAVSSSPELSQRAISEQSGLSLGLTNILLNRLVKKGYMKTVRLNPRRIRYLLTPRGIKEKSRKTYLFMLRSLSAVTEIRTLVEEYVSEKYASGVRSFIIIGGGELSDIAELTIKAMHLEDAEVIKTLKLNGEKGAVLHASHSERVYPGGIDLWKEAETIYGSSYEL